MSGFRIVITATAREQLREISRWWRENMREEPELLILELEASVQRLAACHGPAVLTLSLTRPMFDVYSYAAANTTSTTPLMSRRER